MYVATYRRRPAGRKESPEITRRRVSGFDNASWAETWLEEQMKKDPRAEIGCVTRDGEVVRIVYAG